MLAGEAQVLLIGLAVFGCFATLGYSAFELLSSEHSRYEDRAVAAFGQKLTQIYVFMDPEKFYHLCIVVAVVFFLIGFVACGGNLFTGFVAGSLLGSLGLVVPWFVVSIMVQKRLQRLDEQLPAGLDMLSSSLRAGLALSQAIARCVDRVPAPLKQEFRVLRQEQRLGHSLVEALHHWAERTDMQDVRLLVIVSEISMRFGGNLAENYETLAELIRQRHVFQREIKSLTAEGRLQAIFMAVLPFIVLIIMTLIDGERMWPFISSTLGMSLLALVAIMQVGAYFWIKKITHIEI